MSEGLRVEVDRGACLGARACTRRAPGSFRLDGERKATPIEPPGDGEEAILSAVRGCPNFALAAWRGEQRIA